MCLQLLTEHLSTGLIQVVVHADVPLRNLYKADRDAAAYATGRREEKLGDLLDSGKYVQSDADEAFAFDRAVSR
eukprot:SAG22_NODE_1883_length_3378_cov_3.332723_5_plen_74_part_00